MGYKEMILFALLWLNVINCIDHGAFDHHFISEEEDLELETQLKTSNKPPIKTILTHYGDIIDCVDINNQPAFDHPVLKDHKIQMKPSRGQPSRQMKSKASPAPQRIKPAKLIPNEEECPPNTVPIRRTTKEDLIRAKSFSKDKISSSNPSANGDSFHFAVLKIRDYQSENIYYGAQAYISAYNPRCEGGQESNTAIWIGTGPMDNNSVHVGWTVFPALYGDDRTRLYMYWTADGYHSTGCYDLLCPGFVQVDNRVTIGGPLANTSIYGGDQYEIKVNMYQDRVTQNWWFVYSEDEIHVGYWPKELLPQLAEGASSVQYGGSTRNPTGMPNPPMGSGYFDYDYYHTCFFRQLHYINGSNMLITPTYLYTKTYVDSPNCYALDYNGYSGKLMGYALTVGGAGGQC